MKKAVRDEESATTERMMAKPIGGNSVEPSVARSLASVQIIGAILILFLAACAPARLAIYSRPGGAEVFVNDQLVARTISEIEPVRIDVEPGTHRVAVEREGYIPWEQDVVAKLGREVAILADLVMTPPPPLYRPLGTVEIRTDPGGALVLFEGEEIGFTSAKEYKPISIENLDPGRYKVVVDREGYQPAGQWVTVYGNQTTRLSFELEPLTPYYMYPTNDDLLRQSVMQAVRGIPYMAGMRTTKSIALVDLENKRESLNALIEDVVIAELAYAGRPVAEREDHLLVRIANEAARGDTLYLEVLTHHLGPDQPFIYDARQRSAAHAMTMLLPQEDGPPKQVFVRQPPVNPAQIPTADQILGYRIVEKSLRIDPSVNSGHSEPMLRREAIVRLYFRLLDAKTGMVEWAQRFEATVVDEVPERVYRYLEQPPDRLYAYEAHPSGAALDRPDTSPYLDVELLAASDLPKPDEQEAIFWYHRNVGEAYLRAGRAREAVYHLREASMMRPRDYDTLMFLGQALLGLGQIDEAGESFRAAIRGIAAG